MPQSSNKPHVIVNVAMSVDGKITTHRREKFSLGSKEDRRLMDLLRARADAVIVGARTVKLDGWAIRVRDTELRQKRTAKLGHPHPLNVVLSTGLDLRERCQFFDHPSTEKLIVTTPLASQRRIKRFKKLSDVWVTRSKSIRPAKVLDELKRRGYNKILLEGGGELNFSFLRDKLVDEIYVTVTPRILGGHTSPTPADGSGLLKDNQISLELMSSRRKDDEVFLRYRVKPG